MSVQKLLMVLIGMLAIASLAESNQTTKATDESGVIVLPVVRIAESEVSQIPLCIVNGTHAPLRLREGKSGVRNLQVGLELDGRRLKQLEALRMSPRDAPVKDLKPGEAYTTDLNLKNFYSEALLKPGSYVVTVRLQTFESPTWVEIAPAMKFSLVIEAQKK